MAFTVLALGTCTENGNRCSSAIRNINKRMASDTDKPIASRAAVARALVSLSIRARTTESELIHTSRYICSFNVATNYPHILSSTQQVPVEPPSPFQLTKLHNVVSVKPVFADPLKNQPSDRKITADWFASRSLSMVCNVGNLKLTHP